MVVDSPHRLGRITTGRDDDSYPVASAQAHVFGEFLTTHRHPKIHRHRRDSSPWLALGNLLQVRVDRGNPPGETLQTFGIAAWECPDDARLAGLAHEFWTSDGEHWCTDRRQ